MRNLSSRFRGESACRVFFVVSASRSRLPRPCTALCLPVAMKIFSTGRPGRVVERAWGIEGSVVGRALHPTGASNFAFPSTVPVIYVTSPLDTGPGLAATNFADTTIVSPLLFTTFGFHQLSRSSPRRGTCVPGWVRGAGHKNCNSDFRILPPVLYFF